MWNRNKEYNTTLNHVISKCATSNIYNSYSRFPLYFSLFHPLHDVKSSSKKKRNVFTTVKEASYFKMKLSGSLYDLFSQSYINLRFKLPTIFYCHWLRSSLYIFREWFHRKKENIVGSSALIHDVSVFLSEKKKEKISMLAERQPWQFICMLVRRSSARLFSSVEYAIGVIPL